MGRTQAYTVAASPYRCGSPDQSVPIRTKPSPRWVARSLHCSGAVGSGCATGAAALHPVKRAKAEPTARARHVRADWNPSVTPEVLQRSTFVCRESDRIERTLMPRTVKARPCRCADVPRKRMPMGMRQMCQATALRGSQNMAAIVGWQIDQRIHVTADDRANHVPTHMRAVISQPRPGRTTNATWRPNSGSLI